MNSAKLVFALYAMAMNIVAGSTFLIGAQRFAASGNNAVQGALTLAIWSGTYSIGSLIIGRFMPARLAETFCRLGTGITAAAALGFVVVPQLNMQYFWIFLVGVGFAFYCTPYQVLIREFEAGVRHGIARAVALYSFSWSFGVATGPFLVGMLWSRYPECGWQIACGINAVLALAITFSIRPLRRKVLAQPKTSPATAGMDADLRLADPALPPPAAARPDLAWLGWTMLLVGLGGITLIRTLFPYKADALKISIADLGGITATVYFVHAGISLLLIRSRKWMYQVTWPVLFTLLGVAAMLLFGRGTAVASFYLGAVLMGLFSGMFSFCMCYFSQVHPTRSALYVSINELMTGIAGVLLPLLGGFLGNRIGFNAPFLGMAGLAAVLVLIEIYAYCRPRQRQA